MRNKLARMALQFTHGTYAPLSHCCHEHVALYVHRKGTPCQEADGGVYCG